MGRQVLWPQETEHPLWETRNRRYLKNTSVLSLKINAIIRELIEYSRRQGQTGPCYILIWRNHHTEGKM